MSAKWDGLQASRPWAAIAAAAANRPEAFVCLQADGKVLSCPKILLKTKKLPGKDSNLERGNQNPLCYHYTTG